jgi:hypothetical protein
MDEFEPLAPLAPELPAEPPPPTVIVYVVPTVKDVVLAKKPPAPPPPPVYHPPPPPPATIKYEAVYVITTGPNEFEVAGLDGTALFMAVTLHVMFAPNCVLVRTNVLEVALLTIATAFDLHWYA